MMLGVNKVIACQKNQSARLRLIRLKVDQLMQQKRANVSIAIRLGPSRRLVCAPFLRNTRTPAKGRKVMAISHLFQAVKRNTVCIDSQSELVFVGNGRCSMDRRRTSVVPSWPQQAWQRRLAGNITQIRTNAHSNPSSKPRPKILH